jgi:hypothetical protein
MAHGMTSFVAVESALGLLPVAMTMVALAWWWRSFERRGLFGVTSLLALVGMEEFIRHWVIPLPVVAADLASGTSFALASGDMDAALTDVFRVRTQFSIVAIVLLLVVGTAFLAWLQRAFRPR